MINELLKIFGLKNEIDNSFKKMLEFPKTLIIVSSFSLTLMIINTFTEFLRFNRLLNDSLYALILFVLLIGIGMRIKIEIDFKKAKNNINKQYWQEYSSFYKNIINDKKFGDISINIEENMLSNKIKYQCVDQEINENMICEFIDYVLDGKSSDTNLIKKYPMENWDIYTIYGLKKAIVKNGIVTLYMKEKLPNINQQTDKDADIISMYLNAYSTLTKEKQVIYKKEINKEKLERKIIDVEKDENTNIIDENELVVREMLNNEKFKDKDISEIINILNKVKEEKKDK